MVTTALGSLLTLVTCISLVPLGNRAKPLSLVEDGPIHVSRATCGSPRFACFTPCATLTEFAVWRWLYLSLRLHSLHWMDLLPRRIPGSSRTLRFSAFRLQLLLWSPSTISQSPKFLEEKCSKIFVFDILKRYSVFSVLPSCSAISFYICYSITSRTPSICSKTVSLAEKSMKTYSMKFLPTLSDSGLFSALTPSGIWQSGS